MDVQIPNGAQGRSPRSSTYPAAASTSRRRQISLDQRTYVAEAGFVVASVQYRTVDDGIYADATQRREDRNPVPP